MLIFLAMVLLTLRAGEHGVVVRHQDAAGVASLEQVAVDAANPGNHSVGRGALDQIVERAAAALRRDHQRAVLEKVPGSHRSSTFSRAVR